MGEEGRGRVRVCLQPFRLKPGDRSLAAAIAKSLQCHGGQWASSLHDVCGGVCESAQLRRGASGRLLTAILGLARCLRTKVEGECGPEGSPGGLWGTSCPGEGLRRAHLRLLLLLPAEGCEFQDWREVAGACAPGREGDVRHRQVAGPLAAQCYTDSRDGRVDTEHQCVDILACCRAALW
jgi:hypothetical protein